MPSKVRGLFSPLFCLGRRRRCRLGTAKPKVSRTQGFASARALGSGGSRTCGTCMSRPFWCAHPCSSHPVDQRAAASSWACAGGPRTNNRRPTPTPVADHVVHSQSVLRSKGKHGRHARVAVLDTVAGGECTLPHVCAMRAVGGERVAPWVHLPLAPGRRAASSVDDGACEPSLEPVRMMLY